MVDVIDVNTQQALEMTLQQWVKYFTSEDREEIYNVISLEFSHTKLEDLVEPPEVVSISSRIADVLMHFEEMCLTRYFFGNYFDFFLLFSSSCAWFCFTVFLLCSCLCVIFIIDRVLALKCHLIQLLLFSIETFQQNNHSLGLINISGSKWRCNT